MIDKKFLDRVEKINKLPVNQTAKQLLKQVKRVSYPESLYALQLAMWAIESEEIRPKNSMLTETLIGLLREDPERVSEALNLRQIKPVGSPARLANEIIQELHALMIDKVSDYTPNPH